MYLPKPGYKRIFVLILYVILFLTGAALAWKYLFIVLLPFFIAWILAYFLQKPISFLKDKCRIPKKLSAIILILLVISVISALLAFFINQLANELSLLYSYAKDNTETIAQGISETLNNLQKALNKLPLTKFFNSENFGAKVKDTLLQGLLNIASGAVEKIPSFATTILSLVPNLIIFIIILIFSAYYLTADFAKINGFVLSQFNDKVTHFLTEFKKIFFSVISKFIKAYVILFFITLAIIFIGLLLIGVKFAFVVALIIAIVDLLPVLGSGTVLIPWSIVSLLTGDFAMAIKIIVLYLAITFIRQMIQPRIIGDFIGLHPLASLLSIFIGYAVMGILGMFVFPIVLIILKTMNDNKTISLWKTPPENDE